MTSYKSEKEIFDRVVQRQRKAEPWLPIDTAPLDGMQIDLWCQPPRGQISSGSYGRVPDCWFCADRWWRVDIYEGDDQCRREVHNATHWMPRPAPPQKTDQESPNHE
jgi:hypothetical protein